MFRSKLRKWLPDPDSIRHNKWLRWCAPVLGHPRLWHLHRRGVALGVAIGMVTGMIPGPVQMLVAGIIAVPLRANIPAAMFATLYTNPFTFVPLLGIGTITIRGASTQRIERFANGTGPSYSYGTTSAPTTGCVT